MIWEPQTQDWIVHAIVAATALYLLFPFLSTLKSLFGKTSAEEIRFGCYEDACSSCRVVPIKKETPLRKRKNT
ncbi:hypothetical protein EHO61_06690 [Leptospira fluminis]|uniref:Uncharacterized protein n=1 Tax=Leptospira fluminis TaxID=2484979 RepID=A0A4R9GRB3_9LEPT|nr:hypothetical protein EHO61_06690 [Leptospira fluminis]